MKKQQKKTSTAELTGIVITQSNRVTSAKYDYSLMQERVLNMVMYHLQVYVKQVMDGKRVHQLDLFSQQSPTHLIDLPLYYITTPDHYNDVRSVCEKMATIPVAMIDNERKTRIVTGLISSVKTEFKDLQRVNRICLEMRTDVITMLLQMDRNHRDQPSQYTQYLLSVAMNAKNKYTAKIYKFLCSWKVKGGCRVSLQEFRDYLQLPDTTYKNFADLKRFVLVPVQKELQNGADLWFNCASSGFEEREKSNKKKVAYLNFKIIVPVSEEFVKNKITAFMWALQATFRCSPKERQQVLPLLNKDTDWELLNEVTDRCYIYAQENTVDYLPAYVIRSIINALKTE